MKYLSIIVFTIILFFYKCDLGNKNRERDISQKKDSIMLINKPCEDLKSLNCSCIKQVFKQDSNIYFLNSTSNTIHKFEQDVDCFKINLIIYGFEISLDSIYYSNISNKKIHYIHGFCGGTYKIFNDVVVLRLYFINNGINSSSPTDHIYTIKYNRKQKVKPSIDFKFLE